MLLVETRCPDIPAWTKDKKKLIDTHYGAIAAKAVMMKPKDLTVQDKAQEEFEKQSLWLHWLLEHVYSLDSTGVIAVIGVWSP